MAFAPGQWLRDSARVYVGNATATRDFRVQLRGSRAVWLWAMYLGVLIIYGMMSYSMAGSGAQLTITEAQSQLQRFYTQIMALLGFMICLVAPALTATAVVAERQRQSLDLIFSAPVEPKYYLVGKMISSYRYTWMMLVLSLPVTSACVVLGGSTWADVLGGYMLLSFHALVLTAIALFMSTISIRPIPAIVWSYLAAAFYAGFGTFLATSGRSSPFFGSQSLERPLTFTFSPFMVADSAPSYTEIAGTRIPNWVLFALLALLFTKLMLLAAGSALSVFRSAEVKSLRIHGLLYVWAFMFSVPFMMSIGTSPTSPIVPAGVPVPTSAAPSPQEATHMISLVIGWCAMALVAVIPFLTCYSTDQEKRYWPDGTLKLRNIFVGTPSGGLPYVWLLILGSSVAVGYAYSIRTGSWPLDEFYAVTFYLLALWTFFWSLGRWTSSSNPGVRVARTMHFAALVAIGALPVPFFTLLQPSISATAGATIWDLYIMRPLLGDKDNTYRAVAMGFALFVLALIATLVAERNAAVRGMRLRTNE